MAESWVSNVVEHIGTVKVTATLFDVVSEAKAVCLELKKIDEKLARFQQTKQLTHSDQMRHLVATLRKIAYDAEDVVDTYISEVESRVALISSLSLGLLNLCRAYEASKKLRMLCKQVKEVNVRIDLYKEGSTDPKRGLRTLPRGSLFSKSQRHQYDEFVVGYGNDVEILFEKLMCDLDVLAIVGMGGSGKSTLARTIYNHKKVRDNFYQQAWMAPSRDWNSFKMASEILKVLDNSHKFQTEGSHENESYGALKLQLHRVMKKTPFLLVLDDVWDCHTLQDILQIHEEIEESHLRNATKIIITSRQRLQPSDTHLNWGFHEMKLLSDDDSRYLFNKVSTNDYGRELAREYPHFAMEMLKKCEGLPLAIVALGRLLKTKDTIQEWERVFSQLTGKEGPYVYGPVNDILALSYDDLQYYLKPCFLYFGLFQEDSTVSAGKMERLWIAEGFVNQQCRDNETLEDAARRLLQELIDHNIVQVAKRTYDGKAKVLRVHDIIRDLCRMKAQELEFLVVCSSSSDQMAQKNSRRATINLRKASNLPVYNTHLRSLLVKVDKSSLKGMSLQQPILDLAIVFDKFKLLRVLDIKGIKTYDGCMPKQIGSLIHLQYLRIRSTNIRTLPKSIGKLRKLLTLDYRNVTIDSFSIRLPNVLWKLTNLRHLYLPYEMRDKKENFKLHTIKGLQTLWGVKSGKWMLKEMEKLSLNLKKLCIQGISNSDEFKSVINCPVIKTSYDLCTLSLDWYGFSMEPMKQGIDVLSGKSNLRKLRLMGKAPDNHLKKLKFPLNLGKLELYYTQLVQPGSMLALGELKCLKFLRLAKDSYLGDRWVICGENGKVLFPQLEELKLSSLPVLREWKIGKRMMPCLKRLSIVSCTNLQRLPEELELISSLTRLKISRMPTSFTNRLRKVKGSFNSKGGGEDFFVIQHIPNVMIQDSCAQLF